MNTIPIKVEWTIPMNICPICDSKNVTKPTCLDNTGCWVHLFSCNDCGGHFAHNEGDKMGGQFDSIHHYLKR